MPSCLSEWKELSEVIKNFVSAAVMLGGVAGVVAWLYQRKDRATDTLLKLEDEFKKGEVMNGRKMVEDTDYGKSERSDKLDALLRFYVVLYGVLRAKQIPEESMSICFRYWLAHYYRKDRLGFRSYVEQHYPTLTRWLREDCKNDSVFFRPHRLFKAQIDEEFVHMCRKEPIP